MYVYVYVHTYKHLNLGLGLPSLLQNTELTNAHIAGTFSIANFRARKK